MQAVHIVASHNVGSYFANVRAVHIEPRVEQVKPVILKEAFGVLYIRVRHSQLLGCFGLGSEGVNPCVQFHTALVTLCHHPGQGVPIRVGGRALAPSQKTAPRLVGRGIHGISLTTHLKHDGIHATLLQHVELVCQIGLHLVAAHAHKLAIYHLYPCPTKLTFGQYLQGRDTRPQQQ